MGRGGIVFREGDTSDAIYLILSGQIRLSHAAAAGGKEATVAVLGRRELFGETCLLLGKKKRVLTAQAAVRDRTGQCQTHENAFVAQE